MNAWICMVLGAATGIDEDLKSFLHEVTERLHPES